MGYMSRPRSRSPRPASGTKVSTQGDDEIAFGPSGHDFAAPEPLPPAAQQRVQELLESGRLFRYQGGAGDVADLEREFTEYIGMPYTMACNSGGCGIFLALKAVGVKDRAKVLVNAWTLAPVPGAIVHAGGTPVFVATDRATLAIDIQDLEVQAKASGAQVLLLSYMRGHVPDMDKVMEVVRRLGLTLVEDCAHTLGGMWRLDGEDHHRHLGAFGDASVWSLQTNKAINCGEGGLISTSRQDVASYITVATGSYGHFGLNGASGDREHTARMYTGIPNMSMRMSNLAAALALPQLRVLPGKLALWERHAAIIRRALAGCPHMRAVPKPSCESGKERAVWTSIQFELVDFSASMVEEAISRLGKLGIPLAWFGGPWRGFTSTLKDWKFADPSSEQWKPAYAETLKVLVDLPLYHTASWRDSAFTKLAAVLVDTITDVANTCSDGPFAGTDCSAR
eukprot:CAMPEP_0204533560 /NCGR_PEP_ID=MMETSP0661-20131031/12356_1 /ASSEMBLY_ACC=CAM_ASM_000606 /TAXON_ID=109239 /ORGANISM="Alexandrium margalefi, Strain AMGDE01CS-322" /LENGTH=452 /DNA_ID=CAMNT_0051539917 /DNA_START=47 /DNA_END=1405 /DNA_ORIENTATION=-